MRLHILFSQILKFYEAQLDQSHFEIFMSFKFHELSLQEYIEPIEYRYIFQGK